MEDLLHFLSRYWFLIIILLPWIGSVLGDVFTKAAQKAAAEERARRRRAQSEGLGGEELQPQKRASAEEVAAEIRRMMGMEVQEERRSPSGSRPVVEQQEESRWDWEPPQELREGHPQIATERAAPQPTKPQLLPEPQAWTGGGLERRLARREARQISTVAGRHVQPATAGGGLHEHHLETGLMAALMARGGSRGARRRVARSLKGVRSLAAGQLVDVSDPARAFVMLEVLGKPKALRDQGL